MVRSLALAALIAAAPNCPDLYSLGVHGFAVPTVAARSAAALPGTSGLRVSIQFAAHNPNTFPITLSSVDYDVAIEGSPVFSGSQGDVSVANESDGIVALSGILDVRSPVFQGLRPGANAHYVLSGTAHVATPAGVPVDVEFSTPGVFVVPAALPAGF